MKNDKPNEIAPVTDKQGLPPRMVIWFSEYGGWSACLEKYASNPLRDGQLIYISNTEHTKEREELLGELEKARKTIAEIKSWELEDHVFDELSGITAILDSIMEKLKK